MNNLVIGMLAHVDAGKTTLSEALLYSTGTIRKLGRVDMGNAFLDTDTMERKRGITIFSKQAQLKLGNMSVTLLDTPGHVDFSAEMERTLQVLDYAILIVSAADGIQSHTVTLWRLLSRYHIPVFIFVNKTDQPGINKAHIFEQLKLRLSNSIVNFTNPDFEEIALCDEDVLNNYLETGHIDDTCIANLISARKLFPCFFGSALKMTGIDEFIKGIEKYTIFKKYPDKFGAKVFKISRDAQGNRLAFLKITGGSLKVKMPVNDTEKINQIRIYSGEKFTTSDELSSGCICAVTGLESSMAGDSLGIENNSCIPLLEPVLTYKLLLPDGVDALEMLPKLRMLEEEHPELHVVWNELLKEIQIQIMGAVQIEIVKDIILKRFNIDVSFGHGNIIYKETIKNTVEGVGHFEPLRHYAEVHLIIEPKEPGSGIEYAAECSEDILDKNWQRLILSHLYEKNQTGVLTGSPLTDVKITLVSGRAHQKHTKGGDFRQATYRAVRQGLMQAESVLLEPFYSFTLEIPRNCVGRAMTDLERMKASFSLENLSSEGDNTEKAIISGSCPAAAIGDYQTQVIAYTKGMGHLSLRMKGYEPCHNADEVIEKFAYNPDADTLNPSGSVFCSHGSGINVTWDDVFNHMHIESVLAQRNKFSGDNEYDLSNNTKRSGRTVSDEILGTEEVDAILHQTYYANSRKDNTSKKRSHGKKIIQSPDFAYKGKETTVNDRIPYLLVDGYNIIYAWNELKELADINMDAARGRLMDILCNYQAMTKCSPIVVFDAYRVKGHDTEIYDYHNIHVVFTKEAETADQYIEKFAHENGRKYYIRVATSDGLEQIIIRGQGCHLVSAREFEQEVLSLEEQLRVNYNL